MKVKIKKLHDNAQIPVRQTDQSAGVDLHALIDSYEGSIIIKPNMTVNVHTGIAVEIPNGYMGLVMARSGLSIKKGLRLANCVGLCDSDYRGEVIVALHNDSSKPQIIMNNERIAQYVVVPYLWFEFVEVKQLTNTERGEGGFGSTGI